ncbi:MAG: S9 family peptidase [Bryobacterales bacterium]|nr:S9 family peptidase [Bryobacterales bacterium]
MIRRRPLTLCLAAILLAALPAPAKWQNLDAAFQEASASVQFDSVAVSPDGRSIAWVEKYGAGEAAVRVRFAGHAARRIEEGGSVSWSPDSTHIAYLSANELHVASARGGHIRTLTLPDGYLQHPAWSPDGRRIAVLYTENRWQSGGPLDPVGRQFGVIQATVPVARLLTVNTGGGDAHICSPPGLNIYEFSWAPDSRRIAAVAAPPPGNANWWYASLYALDSATYSATRILVPHMQIALPRWSPEGARIAFVGGLMSDQGVVGGDVYEVPAIGGPAVNRTPGLDASARALWWTTSGIWFSAHHHGGTALYSLTRGVPKMVWNSAENVYASASADGGIFGLVRSSFLRPPEVWFGAPGIWKPVTAVNAHRKPIFGDVRSLSWKSDQYTVQGWLIAPRNMQSNHRYPMIVLVHGGPASAREPAWPRTMDFTLLASEGYYIFCPNPRGSFGFGEKFTRANVKDFGGGDLRDILRGVDEAIRVAPIDPHRVGITGWSYGGYMTMWAVTQTTRFAAAAAGAGISDWRSYYGQNEINTWMLPYFGASVYDDPAVYARSAPIEFIRNVVTPTLVLVGEYDAECPAPQSFEFWRALKTLGVSTQLVVYQGEGHNIRDLNHRQDILNRMAGWFGTYLK